MAKTNSLGYLYAVHVTNPDGTSGFFSRPGGALSGTKLFDSITQNSFWTDRAATLAKAKRSQCTKPGAKYIVHEFSYVLNRLDDEGSTEWNGRIKVHVDEHGQYIVYKSNIYRPQVSTKALRNTSGYGRGRDVPGDLDVERVKLGGVRRYGHSNDFHAYIHVNRNSFNQNATRDIPSARDKVHAQFRTWRADPATTLTTQDQIQIITRDMHTTTWFNHGNMRIITFDDEPTITINTYGQNGECSISAEAKLHIARKKRPTAECWLP